MHFNLSKYFWNVQIRQYRNDALTKVLTFRTCNFNYSTIHSVLDMDQPIYASFPLTQIVDCNLNTNNE